MKRLMIFIILCLPIIFATAQSVQVTSDKTTSLIFPFAILHVDRGSKDILVQPVKETENILLVKAAIKNFEPTNLSVVTTDGSLYAISVQYNETPESWVYKLPPQKSASIESYANGILDNPRTMWGVKDNSWNVNASVIGTYIKDNTLYYQIRLSNNTSINYDIDIFRCYIRDNKKSKRTAVQENELKLLHVAGNVTMVKPFHQNIIVVALDKFTIPDKKYMGIEIMEKNGGRHLTMKVKNKNIIRAIPLPDLK